MIDWMETIRINKMSYTKLQNHFKKFPKSGKRVVIKCDMCEKERVMGMSIYKILKHKGLCKSCAVKGHEVTEKTKLKISQSHKGIKPSDETRIKMSESAKLRPEMTIYTRKKISEFHKGNAYNIGRKASEETKHKMSEIHKGKIFSSYTRGLLSKALFGHEVTSSSKIKISCGHQHINLDKFNGFIGRHNNNRDYALPEEQCHKLNNRFKESHGHHITKSVMAYIPAKLHRKLSHNLKTGVGMININRACLKYIKRERV